MLCFVPGKGVLQASEEKWVVTGKERLRRYRNDHVDDFQIVCCACRYLVALIFNRLAELVEDDVAEADE